MGRRHVPISQVGQLRLGGGTGSWLHLQPGDPLTSKPLGFSVNLAPQQGQVAAPGTSPAGPPTPEATRPQRLEPLTISASAEMTLPRVVRDLLMLAPSCAGKTRPGVRRPQAPRSGGTGPDHSALMETQRPALHR